MKIIFLCGSLEPGRDGVGDYVRRLSGTLINFRHEVFAIALFDRFIDDTIICTQEIESNPVPVFRIPATYNSKKRLHYISEWVNMIDPDWLSLQYVPFSFQSKGLPFGLSKKLRVVGTNRNWHIMFHELWVGMAFESPKKQLIWGWIQKQLVKSFIVNLKPSAIHTQSKLYQAQLETLRVSSEYLRLFSNIPVRTANDPYLDSNHISLVVFGTIHPGAPIADFAVEAADYAKEKNLGMSITFVGRCGNEIEHWIAVWKSVGVKVIVLGEQSQSYISEVLNRSSIGISTSALAMIDKSGTVAAMLEHGLPVICVSHSWRPRKVKSPNVPDGVLRYTKGNFKSCLIPKHHLPSKNVVSDISLQLCDSFLKVSVKK